MNQLTLSTEEIKKINDRHIHDVDKWYRIMEGISSRLISVREGIISLEVLINFTETHDPEKTTSKISETWRRFNPELGGAALIEVSVYKTRQLKGLLIKAEDCSSAFLDDIMIRLKEEPERKLVFIYRKVINNTKSLLEYSPKTSEN